MHGSMAAGMLFSSLSSHRRKDRWRNWPPIEGGGGKTGDRWNRGNRQAGVTVCGELNLFTHGLWKVKVKENFTELAL